MANFLPDPEDLIRTRSNEFLDKQLADQRALTAKLAQGQHVDRQLGTVVGSALGGGLARGLFGEADARRRAEADPDVIEAQRKIELATGLTGLTEGEDPVQPGSAEFYRRAVEVAKSQDNPAAALEFGLKAREVEMQEQKQRNALEVKAREEDRANFNSLPSTMKMLVMSEDPARIKAVTGASDKQVAKIQKDARDFVETKRLKNAKALADIRPAKNTKTTKADIDIMGTVLASQGLGPDAFTQWFGMKNDAKEFGQFAAVMAQQVRAELDEASQRGERLSEREVVADIKRALEAGGALTVEDDGTVSEVDSKIVNDILNLRSGLGSNPDEGGTNATPRKRSGVLKVR